MKKEAYADSIIQAVGSRPKHLAKHCNLNSPEVVKGFIAQKSCSYAFEETLVEAYDLYCRANRMEWSKLFYKDTINFPEFLLKQS